MIRGAGAAAAIFANDIRKGIRLGKLSEVSRVFSAGNLAAIKQNLEEDDKVLAACVVLRGSLLLARGEDGMQASMHDMNRLLRRCPPATGPIPSCRSSSSTC